MTRHSTREEIKRAYRILIKNWHPDKFPNQQDKIIIALEKSKEINEAFSLLENYQAPIKTKRSSASNSTTNYNSKTESTYKPPPP